jgi:hypothetical protein
VGATWCFRSTTIASFAANPIAVGRTCLLLSSAIFSAPTWPPGSRSLKQRPLLFRTIFRFVSRVLGDDDLRDPVAEIVAHMDFEIDWALGPALSASEPSASPIHNDGGDLFGRFVDNDVASFKGQRDVENLEPSEAAIFPFLLLDANFAGRFRPRIAAAISPLSSGFWVRTTIDPVMRWGHSESFR